MIILSKLEDFIRESSELLGDVVTPLARWISHFDHRLVFASLNCLAKILVDKEHQ